MKAHWLSNQEGLKYWPNLASLNQFKAQIKSFEKEKL